MRKALKIAAVAIALLLLGGVLLWLHFHAQRPEALLAQLARGKGDREELIMRLNVARGDVVGPMIAAFRDENKPATFRADLLELLFKKNFRSTEPRIEETILAAIKDPNPAIRRKAAYGLAVYAEDRLQVALIDCLSDADPEVRRHAYLSLGSDPPWRGDPDDGVWGHLTDAQKDQMIQICTEQAKNEEDPAMRLFARAVIGREIEIRSLKAVQALQRSDLAAAEETFRSCLELDPENRQAQIRLVRFLIKNADQDRALAVAREYGALIEVPLLSKAPIIDGDPTDQVWAEAFVADTFYHTTSRWVARTTKGTSRAYIGHHDGTLYIGVIGYEEDLSKLVVRYTTHDSNVWSDDCVELIFDPDLTGTQSYQFVVNPVGALFDNFNQNISKNFKCRYKAQIFNDRGYWAMEFALNGEDLDGHDIEAGTLWSLNIFRVRIGGASEHGAIWPLFGAAHRMDLYPVALFK